MEQVDYLLKGISMDELEKAINTVHSGGAMINPEGGNKGGRFLL